MLAYRLIYAKMIDGRSDDDVAEIDAILQLPGAVEAYDQHRVEMVESLGFEIGGR